MAPDELKTLIRTHRRNGLLLDANLALLYLVGKTSRSRIPKFKRTQKYTVRDFEFLTAIVVQFDAVITTPHILTEVSNLAKPLGTEQTALCRVFLEWVDSADERFQVSREVARHPVFERLGLTDAAVACAARKQMLVLTDDLDLYLALLKSGADCVNFSHIRPM